MSHQSKKANKTDWRNFSSQNNPQQNAAKRSKLNWIKYPLECCGYHMLVSTMANDIGIVGLIPDSYFYPWVTLPLELDQCQGTQA